MVAIASAALYRLQQSNALEIRFAVLTVTIQTAIIPMIKIYNFF